jgi:hypothetical protein
MQMGRANKVMDAIAAQSSLGSKTVPRSELVARLLSNAQPEAAAAQEAMKMLPAPDVEFSADRFGNVAKMTDEQRLAAALARRHAAEMGITPDVTANIARQEARAKTSPLFDALESKTPPVPPGAIPSPPSAVGLRLQSLLNANSVMENPNSNALAQALDQGRET